MHTTNRVNSFVPRWRNRWAFMAVGVVILLAMAASFLFATPLDGPGTPEAKHLDTGWSYLRDGTKQQIASLPVTLEVSEEPLLFFHQLTDEETSRSRDVLTLRSRYASVSVWADDTLIYEAAQGKEHALGSMWHFIPMSRCADAEWLTVELRPYDNGEYTMESVLLDTPGAVRHELITDNLSAILFGSVCLILAIAVLIASILLKQWKSPMYAPLVVFAMFLLLSGGWIFLDSKITTLNGGNYALSYFLSYAAFYLLQVPLLLYIRFLAKDFRRVLSVLIWLFILNAALSFVLHMAGLVQIRHMAVIVHGLIIVSLPVCTMALWKSVIRRKEHQFRFTFMGMLAIYVFGLISIVFYHLELLPAANSTYLYMVGLSLLIIGMTVDMLISFGQFRQMQEYTEHYRRLAMEDSVTMLGNRNAFELHLKRLAEHSPKRLAFVVFDVDDLKQINDRMGHHIGDQAIYAAAQCIRAAFGDAGDCYRVGGDEFTVILTGKAVGKIPFFLERFQKEITTHWNKTLPSHGASYGWASAEFSKEAPVTAERILRLQAEADRSLYQQKQERKVGKKAM